MMARPEIEELEDFAAEAEMRAWEAGCARLAHLFRLAQMTLACGRWEALRRERRAQLEALGAQLTPFLLQEDRKRIQTTMEAIRRELSEIAWDRRRSRLGLLDQVTATAVCFKDLEAMDEQSAGCRPVVAAAISLPRRASGWKWPDSDAPGHPDQPEVNP